MIKNKIYTAINSLKAHWKFDTLLHQINILAEQLNCPELWNNPANAIKLNKIISKLQYRYKTINSFEEIFILYQDIDATEQEFQDLFTGIHAHNINCIFSEEDDVDCYLQIKAGAGGDEAKDWVLMLAKMYLKYAQNQKFSAVIIDQQIQSTGKVECIEIHCSDKEYLYGYLKNEKGIHRLVRTLDTRRHTSFADIDVFPVVQNLEIKILDSDLEKTSYRGSSPGGQHANTTESGVRLRHIPTGIIVQCNNQRSHKQNMDQALEFLKIKLYKQQKDLELQTKKAQVLEKPSDMWGGNYVRSYILDPYQKVKNYKTGYENSNVFKVLEGELHDFIEDLINLKS